MWIASQTIGFIEVPDKATMNIYAVGCGHGCPGCHMPHLQDFSYKSRVWMDDRSLSGRLLFAEGLVDGVAWLGGDALFQREEFLDRARVVKDLGLFNCVYTGFQFEELDDEVKEVCDIVVDGRWNGHPLGDPLTNQRIFVKRNDMWENILYSDFNKKEKGKTR